MQRRLLARRLDQLEPFVRGALLVVALIGAGLLFWQSRIPIHFLRVSRGPVAAASALAGALGALALLSGASTWGRAAAIARRPPGPAWLTLPVEPSRLGRHLLFEARLPAWVALPSALAVLAAGAGLVPWTWLALLAVAFVVAWLETTRLGAAIAWRQAAARGPARRPLFVRVLAAGRVTAASAARRAPLWRRGPVADTIARKDRSSSARRAGLRSRLAIASAFAALALLAWAVPQPPPVRAALSFAAYLLALATLGLWSAALVGLDPPTLWRPLPLRTSDAWKARVRPLALAAIALPVASAAFAAGLSAPARAGVAIAWWPSGFMVAALALHHALTLYPDSRTAERVTTTWLTLAMVASLMLPLSGWIVLLAGFLHSTRRLARGATSDTR